MSNSIQCHAAFVPISTLISLRTFAAPPQLCAASTSHRRHERSRLCTSAAARASVSYVASTRPGDDFPPYLASDMLMLPSLWHLELMRVQRAPGPTHSLCELATCTAQDVEYNQERNSAYWNMRPVLVLTRTLEIGRATAMPLPLMHLTTNVDTGRPVARVMRKVKVLIVELMHYASCVQRAPSGSGTCSSAGAAAAPRTTWTRSRCARGSHHRMPIAPAACVMCMLCVHRPQ